MANNNEEQIILELYEVLFQGGDRIPIKKLSDLTNEFMVVKMLQEIEPELLIIAEVDKIKLSKMNEKKNILNFLEDNLNICDKTKKENFIQIFEVLIKYFQNCPEKCKLKDNFDLMELVKIDGILNVKLGVNNGEKNEKKSNSDKNFKKRNSILEIIHPRINLTSDKKIVSQDLLKFGEILLVLSAVSTKRTEYLDILCIISDSDDKYLSAYLNILEKYLNFREELNQIENNFNNNELNINNDEINEKDTEINLEVDNNHVFKNRSNHSNFSFKNSITPQNIKWIRQTHSNENDQRRLMTMKNRMTIHQKDKEKFQFLNTIETFENEISDLNKKNEELTNELIELEYKYRDALRENESLKFNQNQQFLIEEDSFNNTLLITNLKNELMKRELEIEDIKRQDELQFKRLKDDIKRYIIIKENLEEKIEDLKNIQFENEKFKLKIRELNLNKDKLNEYDKVITTLEIKNKQIENLIKEKQSLLLNSEKMIKENLNLKEKITEIEFKNQKLENEINDIRIKSTRKYSNNLLNIKETPVKKIPKINSHNNLSNHVTSQQGIILDIINDLSIINFDDTNEDLNNKFENLKFEYEELNINYKDQIEMNKLIIDEKSDLLNQLEKFKIMFLETNSDKEKILLEKEKYEIMKQKIELELNRTNLNVEKLENDKSKFIDENNQFREKISGMIQDRNVNLKELESLKVLIKVKNNQIDKILNEKQILINDYQNLCFSQEFFKKKIQDGIEQNNLNNLTFSLISDELNSFYSDKSNTSIGDKKIKNNISTATSNNSTVNKFKSTKNLPIKNSELNELKNEIAKMKSISKSKDETIKQLKERIKNLEKLEMIIKNKEGKMEKDLLYYKKSYEEQKLKVNQEHELLTNNLCDLGMQFNIFKNELLKNVKPSILQNNCMNLTMNGNKND